MSSHTKDPLKKQDTPSGSSESHSDSDVEKAEENLVHLKIEATKDDSNESKPLDLPNQEDALASKYDFFNEPTAGPSGLQKHRLGSSDGSSDPESKNLGLTDPQKEKDAEAKEIDENIGAKMMEGESSATSEKDEVKGTDENIGTRMEEDSDTTSSTPPFIQSSTGVTPTSMLDEKSSVAEPRRLRRNLDYLKFPAGVVAAHFMKRQTQSSSSRRYDYATDSANTSADISEIRSEMVDSSAEGSDYRDAPENFEKEQTPSYASAVERQSSEETSDTNISEIQDEYAHPPTPESSSVWTSTPSEEQGHRAYMAQLQREAEARGVPISTSSGIGLTNQSELAHVKAWNRAGEIGQFWHNVDDPNPDVPDHGAQGGEPQPTSESMDDEPILPEEQEFYGLFEQEQRNDENREEPNVSADAMRANVARKFRIKESVQSSDVGAGSPSKRRRPSKCLSDSSEAGKGLIEKQKQRRRFKPDAGKRSKMVSSKSSAVLQSSSESPEPKSSSSEELHGKESPDIISSSEFEKGRKLWQKSGLLRSMQLSTMSKDSIIPEEEEDRSSLREEEPEKMESTIEKGGKETTEDTEPSESKPSMESSDQAYGTEAEVTLRGHEQSFDVPDFKRSVGKSKREPKLSSSPPSDGKTESLPEKVETDRPTKKAKPDKITGRRTRHDSGGIVPQSFSPSDLQQGESTSTIDKSDYIPSDEEKETAL